MEEIKMMNQNKLKVTKKELEKKYPKQKQYIAIDGDRNIFCGSKEWDQWLLGEENQKARAEQIDDELKGRV